MEFIEVLKTSNEHVDVFYLNIFFKYPGMKMRKPKVKTFLSIDITALVYRVCIVVGFAGTIYSSNIIRLPDTNEGDNSSFRFHIFFQV